jgi:hypothetical protein
MDPIDFTIQRIDDELTYEAIMDEIYETVFEEVDSVGGIGAIEEVVVWEPNGVVDVEFIQMEDNLLDEVDEIVWVPDHLEHMQNTGVYLV